MLRNFLTGPTRKLIVKSCPNQGRGRNESGVEFCLQWDSRLKLNIHCPAVATRFSYRKYILLMGLGFFCFRKCKIVTNGPWLEVPPVTLWDISIIPSSDADDEEAVALWAISDKGDVLCRLGVTQQNPAVRLPVYFYCLIDVFNVTMQVQTHNRAVPSLTAPCHLFSLLCPRFESPCPSAAAQFAAHVSYNSASLA